MGNNNEWHEDQSLSDKNDYERKSKELLDKNEILNGYSWIKVPKYYEIDPDRDDVDWKVEYQKLMHHHKEETEFLIKKIRELV